MAGPVIAAAAMIRKAEITQNQIAKIKNIFSKIKDSKKLTPQKRDEFYALIVNYPHIEWAVGRVSEKAIDQVNILEATKLAMKKAMGNLERKLGRKSKADFLIIDGNFQIDISTFQKSIIKADEKVFSCIAASIVAKVYRDKIMGKYHQKYPQYGFDRHKGYPTRYHLRMLKKYGPCKIHRRSFTPVKSLVS